MVAINPETNEPYTKEELEAIIAESQHSIDIHSGVLNGSAPENIKNAAMNLISFQQQRINMANDILRMMNLHD